MISKNDKKVYSVGKKSDVNILNNVSRKESNIDLVSKDYSSVNLHLKPLIDTKPSIISGIPVSHQHSINQVANDENIIIGIRPIDLKTRNLIESGNYSSKGLAIKGKSSDWGPHAGFIPISQQFAKKSARKEVDKYNQYIQKSLNEGSAISVVLEISSERVNELLQHKAILPSRGMNELGYSEVISLLDGKEIVFYLKKSPHGEGDFWQLYHLVEGEIKPFYVIGDPKTGKPMTADYDLFSIIFPISELEHYAKVTEMPSWAEWKSGINYDELTVHQKALYKNEAEYNKQEGQDNGITNSKIKEIKNKLNRRLGRTDGMELIHHGADDANPASVMHDNFPITFFLPDKLKGRNVLTGTSESISTYFQMNVQGAIIINSAEQLSNFQQLLINQGYRAPLNKKWSEGDNGQYFDPKRKISESFIEGRIEIARKKSLNDSFEDRGIQKSDRNYDNAMENILGKPIAQLDEGFDDIYFAELKQHSASLLAGESSLVTDSIDTWLDPMLKYRLAKELDAEISRTIKPTEYSYNVIIQLEGDNASTNAVANAFSKHPDDSMVIQFNLKTKQYKILHGDISRLDSGKVRWITVGHGSYLGSNQPTLYADVNARQFSDSIRYLQKKVLNNTQPSKLVLMGCNLGRGGINENFALRATAALSEHNLNMPITAYNRLLKNIYLGNKFVKADGSSNDSVGTKGYKFIYQFNVDTQQVRINKSSSTLYFINELRRGEITLSQLNNSLELDPLGAFRDLGTRQLDFDLIKKVAYNPKAYELFVSELKRYQGILPNSFHRNFSTRLNELGMKSIPIWKMVNSTNIQQIAAANVMPEDNSVSVVIRVVGSPKGRQVAEQIAAKNAKNTIIFQMDIDNKKWTIEYGESEIPSLIESQKPVKWTVIGDSEVIRKPTQNLLAGLVAVKQKYPVMSPESIFFHSSDPHMLTTSAEHHQFAADLSAHLKQHGVNASVITQFTRETVVPTNNRPFINSDSSVLSQTNHQKVQSLLERIALKEIDVNRIQLTEHPYMATYFMDDTGGIDVNKIKIVVNDPLLNMEINRYLSYELTENKAHFDALFELPRAASLQGQAADLRIILQGLHHDPTMINHLSERSIAQLKVLYPSIYGVNRSEIIALVTNANAYTRLNDELLILSGLYIDNIEESGLKNLTLAQVLQIYRDGQRQKHQQFRQLLNQQNNQPDGRQISLFHHGWIRNSGYPSTFDQNIGLILGIEHQLFGVDQARDLVELRAEFLQKQQQGTLSTTEAEALHQIQHYISEVENRYSNKGILLADQSILATLSISNNYYHNDNDSLLFIKGKNSTFTISQVTKNGLKQYSLFDPNGLQISVSLSDSYAAKKNFFQLVRDYFNEEVMLADGKKIIRGQHAGLNKDEKGHFRADLEYVDIVDKKLFGDLSAQRNIIAQHIDPALSSNGWVTFYGEKIALARLQNLGVTVDGEAITLAHTKQIGWDANARINGNKLSLELAMLEGSQSDHALLKIIYRAKHDNNPIIDNEIDFTTSAVYKKQIKIIEAAPDINDTQRLPALVVDLNTTGKKLSLFQRIGSRAGQTMGAAGMTQALISISSLLNKLNNPDLTAEEYSELEKQLYITCGSAFFNYGDMILQPILLKIAGNNGASALTKSRIASGVVVVFNLVGMGIDAYQAYDNLSKLESVTDPKQRQDLIVNASFSIASFVINGVTVVGVLVSSSTIPVVGLVIGGLLIVGGWIYNGRRAVENIKAEIEISWDRELEEGIRGALGLDPTQRTQQEIIIKRYIDSFKHADWEMDLNHFEQTLRQAGFDHHLSVIDKPTYEKTDRYYLVDNDGNYFGGKRGYIKVDLFTRKEHYTKRGAPSYTLQDANLLLNSYVLTYDGMARRKIGSGHIPLFKKELKETFELKRIGSESSDERYSLNPNYSDPLLTQFKNRHQIQDADLILPIEAQLGISHPEQLSFFSKMTKFGPLGQVVISGNYQRYSEHLVDDKQKISWYLNDAESRGSSFNSATGNDLIIGFQNRKNAFQILSGEKYFAGGERADYFYLRDNNLVSLRSRENEPTKFLDGQQGNDTLIIDNLPDEYRAKVNLNENQISYQREGHQETIYVAHLNSIEHIVVRGNTNDEVQGDENHNILDGGLGIDTLYGHDGDDKLILTQGYANGGNDSDSYQIRRFAWFQHINDLNYKKRKFNHETKSIDKQNAVRPKYLKDEKHYNAMITIDETTDSSSIVSLDYSLKEIHDVYVEGNHLYIKIQLPAETIDGYVFTNIHSQVTLELKNIYRSTSKGREARHHYHLRTHDGFILTSQLPHLAIETPSVYRDKLFNIHYLQVNDQLHSSDNKTLLIDEAKGELIIDGKQTYVSPSWGTLLPMGAAKNLTYRGNEKNNIVSHVKSGSQIKVSLGQDAYQISELDYEHGDIIFDFSEVHHQYTDQDKVILLLPVVNGYQLKMEGSRLVLKDRFLQTKLAIRFNKVNEKTRNAVLIQDKHGHLFTINWNDEQGTITPLITVAESTDDNDKIIIPHGYLSEEKLIDAQVGDDIIIDNSAMSHVLMGGDGDDTLSAEKGHNVLYGGAGVDFLTGGNGQDLLLSDLGTDVLMGGIGDDHYLIDGNQKGETYIDDSQGNNQIYLLNFDAHFLTETNDDGHNCHIYFSSHEHFVQIKQPKVGCDSSVKVHLLDEPPEAFQAVLDNGFESLAQHFANKLTTAQKLGLADDWKPANKLYVLQKNIPKPILLTSNVDILHLTNETPRGQWFIDAQAGNDLINDQSKLGRIVKGGDGNDVLLAVGGENILWGNDGNDLLQGGEGQDVLISTQGDDTLKGGMGNDLYIINGKTQGSVTIEDYDGVNQVILINFKQVPEFTNASNDLSKMTFASENGRKVSILFKENPMNVTSLLDVKHINNHAAFSTSEADNIFDLLVQRLVEQRIEYEHNFDLVASPAHRQNRWDGVAHTQNFLNNCS
ncbi:anthrax toxin-like adenylyl cyclase domain-containing protein [Providencia rustigianii]|uniref:anthrax toxin-like adenylyl cyclase domain-containing protein n=1 Tax=Providencia rustigianii TaxID=158850 RepID=UPI00223ED0C4|nr:anthrax toxin-like adenylyl cyclase domain-containing protein [Providencia rustigianii]